MLKSRFENPGLVFLGILFFVPFIFYGLGIGSHLHLLAGLILIIYAVLLVLNFKIGFLTLIFIRSSLDYMKNFNASLNLAALASIALIVLGIFYVLYRRCNILQFEDARPFLVFLLLCGISVGYSPDLTESFSDWLRLLSVFAAYIITRLIFVTEEDIRTALTTVLMSALIPIFLAYFQLVTGTGTISDGGQERIVGTFLHPNAFASYLLIVLIFSTAQFLEGMSFINKHFLGMFLLVTFLIFLFTLSRGAWIVFILAMILMGSLRYRKLLGFLPPLLLIAVVALPAVRDRILNIFEPSHYAAGRSAWEWRLDTWEEIGPMVKEKPWLGHGLAMVETEFGILTHNDYLRLLAEVGMLGLLAYLVLIISLWKRTWRDFRNIQDPMMKCFQLGLLAMIAAFIVRSFADNTLRNTVVMIYFWIFIALVRNMTLLYAKRSEAEEPKVKIERYDEI